MPVRCSAPNRCAYCGTLTAIENATVLRIDAEYGPSMPTVGITLTTHRPLSDVELTNATRSFWRAFRKRWGRVEYCGFIEWTTGKSERSGGVRRSHVHYLVKGLDPVHTFAAVEAWTREQWKALAGAWVVEVRPLRTPAGAVAYLALHHRKQEQGPPPGWSGKRFRPSQRYFNRPVAELRELARQRLAERRQAIREEGQAWDNPDHRTTYEPRPPRVVMSATGEALLDRSPGQPASIAARRQLAAQLRDPEAPANRPVNDSDIRAWKRQTDFHATLRARQAWRDLTSAERALISELTALGARRVLDPRGLQSVVQRR